MSFVNFPSTTLHTDSDNTMASELKRKRAPVEVSNTPKRPKSSKVQSKSSVRKFSENVGWDAAFKPPARVEETPATEVNGNSKSTQRSKSPESVDFEDFMDNEAQVKAAEDRRSSTDSGRAKQTSKLAVPDNEDTPQTVGRTQKRKADVTQAVEKGTKKKANELWKLSEPIGGRLLNIDPVFTEDEKFMIVATRTTLHVYSTSNSLLTRSIKLKVVVHANSTPRIVSFCLSPNKSHILWVACTDGSIFSVNWASGAGAEQFWGISAGCLYMTVASMESTGRRRDVVFTTEVRPSGGFRVTANELAAPGDSFETGARTIYTSTERINFLKTAKEGSVIVGSSGKRILVGSLRSTEYGTIDKIRYEFRIFESTDPIKSLDVKVFERTALEAEGLKKAVKKTPVVNLVVGDVNGVVFLHNDLLAKLFIQSQDGSLPPGMSLAPRKLHWHRQEVHSVKWSLDGNYVISGGTETVLVIWQLDTGKQQFLPHMSATIQNVVVSPTGTSYAVQLSDNSAMILSTAELQPIANISGIQTTVIENEASIESQVTRVEDVAWEKPLVQRTPATINPAHPSRILLGVGQMQEIRASKPPKMSNPFLQTYDISSGHNVSRQALTRTNITNVTAIPSAHRLSEPRVTHIKISHNGQWLVTVDEWVPPARDVEFLKHSNNPLLEEQRHRREVFLKFWQWIEESQTWELVSRINAPHILGEDSGDAAKILDLSADPSSLRFSTIGEDAVVRTWIPRTRKRDGVVVRDKNKRPLRNWICEHAITLRKIVVTARTPGPPSTGCVAFSEDGSLLAAACDGDGVLSLIDPESGSIRASQTGLFENEIFGVKFLGQDLITLSDTVSVFDLVASDVRFGIKLNPSTVSLALEQKQEMMHLAVDERSQTFAVALPGFQNLATKNAEQSLWNFTSELLVFSQEGPDPQLREVFSSIVTALIPAIGSDGYIILDTTAEVHTVIKKGTQAITTMAQSTAALNLDSLADEPETAGYLMRLVEEEVTKEVEQEQLPTPDASFRGNDSDKDEHETPVVTQQQLASIFDIGPAFALPPMEEMFYQVAGLFSAKPLAQRV